MSNGTGNDSDAGGSDFADPVSIPISGELDLHGFRPPEVASLLEEYFHECRKAGILRIRVIHGRGIGQMRRTVWKILERLTDVASFAPANLSYGGAGATWVQLKPSEPSTMPAQPAPSHSGVH